MTMARIKHHLQNTFVPHEGNDYRPHALRPHWLRIYAYLIVGAKLASVLLIGLYSQPAQQAAITPDTIIQLTNHVRTANHVAGLKTNALLTKAAQAKVNDMLQNQYFAHISPKGTTPWVWIKQAGYSYSYAGENLALDFLQAEDVVSAWLNSSTHRQNLFNRKYKDIGVAVASGQLNGVNSILVVQLFGTPLPPPVTKVVKSPVQQPTPTAAKKQLATVPAPKPKVLGENVAPVAPATPMIATPTANTATSATPEVVGQAEPGSTVTLLVNGQAVGQAPVPDSGIYSLQPDGPLGAGEQQVAVEATARGLTSPSTVAVPVIIDDTPPTVTLSQSYILPSPLTVGAYDVGVVASADATTVEALYGGTTTALIQHSGVFTGTVGPLVGTPTGLVTIRAIDQVGNQVDTVLADTSQFSTGVVAPASSPIMSAFRYVFYSRTFILVFLVAMMLLTTFNVSFRWRHQQHASIIGSVLVIYLAGTLLLI